MTKYYTPKQVAYFLYEEKYDMIKFNEIIDEIYEKEYSFIDYTYKEDQNKFLEEAMKYHGYLMFAEEYEKQREKGIDINDHLKKFEKFKENFSPNFFLITRLMLLFNQKHKIIKLRVLLKKYGYKSRVPQIMLKFRENIFFYHLKTFHKGEETDIVDFELDDMITFKLY